MSTVIPPTEATHFACLCGELFAQDEALSEPRSEAFEFWGHTDVVHCHVALCPRCGGEELEDVWACPTCQIRPVGTGLDQCEICFAIDEAHQDSNVKRAKELEAELNMPFRAKEELVW